MARVEYLRIKVYLEGIEIPVNHVTITSGNYVQANIKLTHHNKYTVQFKPGTLIHVFIFYKEAWRVFFVGKLVNTIITNVDTTIRATSLFAELDSAVISPINLENSVYSHAAAYLNVVASDKIRRKETDTEVFTFDANSVNFFNFSNLEKTGNVPDCIKSLLSAASYISPWYRIQADTMRLNDCYYVLDNPNMFPITQKTSVASLINQAYSNFGNQLSYSVIIASLLRQLKYVRIELNTPIKINNEWKWVFLLPDPSFLPPFETEKVETSNFTSFSVTEKENYTRMLMFPTSSDTLLNIVQGTNLQFLYARAHEKPYTKIGDKYTMKYTEEEKYSGVRSISIPLDDEKLIYTLTQWEKVPIDKLRQGIDPVGLLDESEKYIEEIADYEFAKIENSALNSPSYIPILDLDILPLFPIRIGLFKDFTHDVVIDQVVYMINSEGNASMQFVPKYVMYTEPERKNLRWDPDEYKDEKRKDFYNQFRNRDMMTETEYWSFVGLKRGKRWRPAHTLNASVIAQLTMEANLLKDYLFTPLVKDRALPVVSYYKEIFGITLSLPEPEQGVVDFNAMEGDLGPIITEGRDKDVTSQKKDTAPIFSNVAPLGYTPSPLLETAVGSKGDYNAFQDAMRSRESRFGWGIENSYGFLGGFQFGRPRLWDLGWSISDEKYPNGWRPKKVKTIPSDKKIISKNQFLIDIGLQKEAFRRHTYDYKSIIENTYRSNIGTKIRGVDITVSGCIGGAHLLGLGGLRNFIRNGIDGTDANGTRISSYIKLFGGYSL